MNDEATHKPAHGPQDLARLLVSREQAGDVEGMAALYEPDAILDIGDGQLACGRGAIRRFYAELVATGRKFDLGQQRPAIVNGDLALSSTRLPDGVVTAEIARRQGDGTWLWVIDQPCIAPHS
jgi:ketosteroid isomerase-like protein